MYKQFMRNKHPGLKKGKQQQQRRQQDKSATPTSSTAKASEKVRGGVLWFQGYSSLIDLYIVSLSQV